MAGPGWGQGSLSEINSDTGLAEVLLAFITYGGQLWGARRWQESPLTLTNVRWQGPAGQFLDAMRHPGDESYLSSGERAAWVQLALHYPAVSVPMIAGPHGPWVALTLDRGAAQALAGGMPRTPSAGSPPNRSYPVQPGRTTPHPERPSPQSGWRQTPASDPYGSTQYPSNPSLRPGGMGLAGSDSFGMSSPGIQMPGAWPSGGGTSEDTSVIPCVEIDLPASSPDYAREYARDVAIQFAHAVRALPQVGELRGWMRGGQLVLAARMMSGSGRLPTQVDMDNAAQLIADVLGQRALPYTRLTFAEPAEWQAGAPVPE